MQVTELMPTKFAPAERADGDRLRDQVELLAAASLAQELLDTVPKAILVLNQHRQIVAGNRPAEAMLGVGSLDPVIGLRLGEALGCIHAEREEGGCGTTGPCGACSAVDSILASQRGDRESRECLINRNGSGNLDLRIRSTAVQIENQFFTILVAATV